MSIDVGPRYVKDPRALNLHSACLDDGARMTSTGMIGTSLRDPERSDWRVVFSCSLHPRELIPVAGPHLQVIIDEILADIDVEALLASPAGTILATGYVPPAPTEPAASFAFLAVDTATAGGLGEQLAEARTIREDVLRYLDGARVLRSVRRLLPDEITGETLRIPDSTRTDGTWEWHESLNYHVRHHGVRVPVPLMEEMVRRGFRPEPE